MHGLKAQNPPSDLKHCDAEVTTCIDMQMSLHADEALPKFYTHILSHLQLVVMCPSS